MLSSFAMQVIQLLQTENNGLCEINSENQEDVEEHFSYQPGSLFGRLMPIKVSVFEEVYCNKKVFVMTLIGKWKLFCSDTEYSARFIEVDFKKIIYLAFKST